MLRVLRVLLPGLVVALAGCAHGSGQTVQPADYAVRIEVTNNFALPVEIYVLGNGATRRLGEVHPGMTGNFVVPPGMIGNGALLLQAHPSANQAELYQTGPLLLKPGTVVDFHVAPQLFNSTATLRP